MVVNANTACMNSVCVWKRKPKAIITITMVHSHTHTHTHAYSNTNSRTHPYFSSTRYNRTTIVCKYAVVSINIHRHRRTQTVSAARMCLCVCVKRTQLAHTAVSHHVESWLLRAIVNVAYVKCMSKTFVVGRALLCLCFLNVYM